MPLTHGPGARLRTRREFTAVQQQGRRISTRSFTLLAMPNSLGHDRLGIVASRRVGGAVTRNRAKRRIREIFRQRGDDTRAAEGRRAFDFVVIARPETVTAPFVDVRRELVTAIGRLRPARVS